jgi:hypothetical protein
VLIHALVAWRFHIAVEHALPIVYLHSAPMRDRSRLCNVKIYFHVVTMTHAPL